MEPTREWHAPAQLRSVLALGGLGLATPNRAGVESGIALSSQRLRSDAGRWLWWITTCATGGHRPERTLDVPARSGTVRASPTFDDSPTAGLRPLPRVDEKSVPADVVAGRTLECSLLEAPVAGSALSGARRWGPKEGGSWLMGRLANRGGGWQEPDHPVFLRVRQCWGGEAPSHVLDQQGVFVAVESDQLGFDMAKWWEKG